MPSGRKKRHAARRRSIGANTGTTTRTTSFDKESVSGSHVSDDATSPKTSDEVNTWLSVATGTSDRPGDQTFHTEEWVRVSDFDVGTPTSTTHKSDYDAVTEDSYGDVRAQDKLVDWETVNAGTSSSTDDVGEVVVEHPSRPRQDQGKKLEKVLSDSSEKNSGAKSVSSKDSHSSSSSSSSNSTCSGESPSESRKKSDDEERSSSIVVVPSHGEKSSSASVDPRDDYFHGSSAHYYSPEAKEDEHPVIEAVSSDEQEQDDSFAGVEDQAISTIEPASSEEGEEEKYRLFTDVSNLKDLLDQEESSGDSTAHHDTLSTFLSSSMKSSDAFGRDSLEVTDAKAEIPEVLEEEHHQSAIGEKQEPDAKEVKESEQPVVEEVMPKPHASDENLQGENIAEESTESIEPTTPVRASSENPYSFTRSVSDEEIMEPDDVEEQAVQSLDVDENIAKESQDASLSSGIPPPDQHELNQLLEIAHSKEIAQLGKQEEKLLIKEEEELGKGISEPQPLIEILSATDNSKPLEGGELKDLEPVVAEEAPLLKDSPYPAEPEFQVEDALKDKVPELFIEESDPGLNKETHPGLKEEHLYVGTLGADKNTSADSNSKVEESLSEHSKVEESLPEQTSESKIEGHSSSSGDQVPSLHMKDLSTKNEDATLVPLSSIPDTKSSEKQQVAVTPYLKTEEQARPSRSTSMDAGGCCEPVQWIFEIFARWVSPRAIQN